MSLCVHMCAHSHVHLFTRMHACTLACALQRMHAYTHARIPFRIRAFAHERAHFVFANAHTRYHFIAWEDKHPLLELYSEWEDVQYRMEAYNLLRYHADRFSKSVEALEEHLAFKGTHTVLARNNMYFLLKHGLEQYISDSRIPLPELPGAVFTRLDYNLREMRREKRHQAEDAAKYLLSHPADEETDVDAPLAEVNRGGLLEMGVDAITEDLLVEMQSLLRRMTGAAARLLAQRSLSSPLDY